MYTYTAIQLEHKTFGELKAIARELNIVPTGDRRCRQTWIDVLVGVELPLLALIETSPGVTFSLAFLARYSPPQLQIHFHSDSDGQLSLLDFEVESTNEPPDPDDFHCLDDFYQAMAVWDAENLEPLEISLDSMIYWAPCPEEWYWPPQSEDVKFCPCGAVPAILCDGNTVTHLSPDGIVFVPCYKQQLVEGVAGARSPPGGDAVF